MPDKSLRPDHLQSRGRWTTARSLDTLCVLFKLEQIRGCSMQAHEASHIAVTPKHTSNNASYSCGAAANGYAAARCSEGAREHKGDM